MNLELGKKYTTRGGNNITIRNLDYSYNFPFLGDILDKNENHVRIASYTSNGNYKNDGSLSEFDIIELFTK